MSNPQAKRRVMGRIDLAAEGPSASPRATSASSSRGHVSPPVQSLSGKSGSSVRAKVDMSTLTASSSPHHLPSRSGETATPPAGQLNGARPASAMASTAAFTSNVVSPSSPSVASPSIQTRGGLFAVANAFSASPHSSQPVRSPSPVRQLARNPASAHDVLSPTAPNGPSRGVFARDRGSSGPRQELNSGTGHVRVNSSLAPAAVMLGGGDGVTKSHARAQSTVSPLTGGYSHARAAVPSPSNMSLTSSPTVLSRSRSPSPNQLQSHSRRMSQGSGTSSTLSRQAVAATVPVTRTQRGPNVHSRPPLHTNWSSYSTAQSGSEAPSPSVASPFIPSTIARMPATSREPSYGETSVSSRSSSFQQHAAPPPLLSPSLELDAEAQEAKKNRKILDLEITNRSLLAINSGLEVVKLKQANEIRELKKKVREVRSLGTRMGMQGGESSEDEGVDDEDDEGTDDSASFTEGPLDAELEAAHVRCKTLIDGMVNQVREAILYKYEMEPNTKSGNRVLHPVEVEMMESQEGEEADEALSMSATLHPRQEDEGVSDATVEPDDAE